MNSVPWNCTMWYPKRNHNFALSPIFTRLYSYDLHSTLHLNKCTGLDAFSTIWISLGTLAKWCHATYLIFLHLFSKAFFPVRTFFILLTRIVTLSEIGWVSGGHAIFSQNLSHIQGDVCSCIVLMKPSLSTLPEVRAFLPHRILLQN